MQAERQRPLRSPVGVRSQAHHNGLKYPPPREMHLQGCTHAEPLRAGPAWALTCSVSTKLDTWPSSFTPRVWKRAPARAQLMREMRQTLACLCEAYTVRMATTPQMTFSSQSQQLTWCCLRGTCNSWFLQNRAPPRLRSPHTLQKTAPKASSEEAPVRAASGLTVGACARRPASPPLGTRTTGYSGTSERPQARPLRRARQERERSPFPKPPPGQYHRRQA